MATPLEVMQIACCQYSECTFAYTTLLGGEGDKEQIQMSLLNTADMRYVSEIRF